MLCQRSAIDRIEYIDNIYRYIDNIYRYIDKYISLREVTKPTPPLSIPSANLEKNILYAAFALQQ